MQDILIKALEEQDYLMHHGILGQKWGVRRYQNKDGSLTDEGRKRYGKLQTKASNRAKWAKDADNARRYIGNYGDQMYGQKIADERFRYYYDNAIAQMKRYKKIEDKMATIGQRPAEDEQLDKMKDFYADSPYRKDPNYYRTADGKYINTKLLTTDDYKKLQKEKEDAFGTSLGETYTSEGDGFYYKKTPFKNAYNGRVRMEVVYDGAWEDYTPQAHARNAERQMDKATQLLPEIYKQTVSGAVKAAKENGWSKKNPYDSDMPPVDVKSLKISTINNAVKYPGVNNDDIVTVSLVDDNGFVIAVPYNIKENKVYGEYDWVD